MQFGIELKDINIQIKLENSSFKIIGGNWGVFHKSFTKHMHSYYELHYVSNGKGTLVTDECEIPLSKGCFYLLPPRANHEQWSDPKDCLEEYHLSFELLSRKDTDIIWTELLQKAFYDSKQEQLELYFSTISKESNEKKYGYPEIIMQNIQSIFIVLIRSFIGLKSEISIPAPNLDDRRIMIIDDSFLFNYETITLTSLSDQLKLSIRQTQRFIKDKYGVSFSTLKFQSRLHHAAMLLSTTPLSMEEICFQVGYNNVSFFSKAFKEYYGMTPSKYRANNSEKLQG